MIVCTRCKLEMPPLRNGVWAHFGNGHCYAGDTFKCGTCGVVTLVTNSQPHHASPLELEAQQAMGKLLEMN